MDYVAWRVSFAHRWDPLSHCAVQDNLGYMYDVEMTRGFCMSCQITAEGIRLVSSIPRCEIILEADLKEFFNEEKDRGIK